MSDLNPNEGKEFEEGLSFDMPHNQSSVIKVIGVGGGGSNAVNHMKRMGIKGVNFIICNTDAQALENSPVENKIQLGVNLTEGLGAGANPQTGAKAAEESTEEIRSILSKGTKMLFITAGMGGGTGTGAAPVIAKIAKDLNILTVGIVTIPFIFEGNTRKDQAQAGIKELRQHLDSLIVINNNKLRDVYGNLGFKAGFAKADEVLATAAKSIAEVITHHYTTNIDLHDAKTVLQSSGTAIMGSATAQGDERSMKAVQGALHSPLLNDNQIRGAKNVLLLIVSGEDENEITFDEIGEITDYIQNEAGGNANVIMGIGHEASLDNKISITVVATGFPSDQQVKINNEKPKVTVHVLEGGSDQNHEVSVSRDLPVGRAAMDKPLSKSAPQNPEEPKQTIIQTGLFDEEPQPQKEDKPEPDSIQEDHVVNREINMGQEEESFTIFDLDEDTPEVEETIEVVDDAEPNSDPFDFPLEGPNDIVDVQDSKEGFTPPADEIIQETPQEPIQESNPNEKVVFTLEDLERLEDSLDSKPKMASPERETQIPKQEPTKNEDPEIKLVVKEVPKPQNETPTTQPSRTPSREHGNPFDQPLNDNNLRRVEERKNRLKAFQHRFAESQSHIQSMENVPAYKRMGVELSNPSSSNEETISRMTVNDEEGPQLKSNNSYLHDNVD